MAWSDAARRAAVLARRLKRVENWNPPTYKRYDKVGRRDFLTAKIGQRLKRVRNVAGSRWRFGPFKDLLRRERGQ